MKLLIEKIEESQILVEKTEEGKKNYYIEGIYLQSELTNRNGRIYPKSVMMKEVARYVKEQIERDRAVGELGHPDTPTINYDRASHKILSLREDGNNWIGKSRVMDTPMGKVVKTLIDEGVKFGVSSRALGSLKSIKEAQIVQDDLHISTPADIVHDPSAPDAFVNGLMENREWVWSPDGKIIEAEIAGLKREIVQASTAEIEEVSLRIFENFLKRL